MPGKADFSHHPIRLATIADAQALHVLENLSFQTDRLSLRQIRRHLRSQTAALLISENHGEALSAALIFFRQTKGAAKSARLYSLAVSPNARGQGLGKAILSAAIKLCAQHRASSIRLEVRADNISAIALYQAFGFAKICALLGYYQDGGDGVRMILRLGC